jgi:hypothetical protein
MTPEELRRTDIIADTLTGDRRRGELWWTADSMAEANIWRDAALARGAHSVKLEQRSYPPQVDGPCQVDVFVKCWRDEGNTVAGYDVEDGEWMIE